MVAASRINETAVGLELYDGVFCIVNGSFWRDIFDLESAFLRNVTISGYVQKYAVTSWESREAGFYHLQESHER